MQIHSLERWKSLLSLRVFGLLSSSLLLFPQCFGRFVLQPSSGVCQTRETFMELRTMSFIETMGVVWSSMKIPKFDKHLKKAGGHIGRHIVKITIKMKTIVQKPLMMIIIKFHLKNLDKWKSLFWRKEKNKERTERMFML